MFLKKVFLGMGVAMLVVFSAAIPAYASMAPDDVKVEGTVQSIDFVAGTFTVLTEEGVEVTVDAPDGFDLNLLVLGAFVEAKGTAGLDDVINANEIETQDGTEFEVEDEAENVDDDDAGEVEDENEVEDESQDDIDDDDQDDVNDDNQDDVDEDEQHDSDDDHSGSNSGSNSGSDHEDDSSGGDDD